jgi:hypothetical protein
MRFASLAGSSPITSPTPQPAAEREVIWMSIEAIVVLVIGVATLIVAIVGLAIKLVELGRK